MIRPILAALALGIVFGAFGAWKLIPRPPPEVRTVERVTQGATVEHVRTVEGPVRVETRTVTREVPGPERPGPVRETIVTRIEERAPVIIERAAEAKALSVERGEVRITPVSFVPPNWAVGLGAQLLPDTRVELGIEHRLFGPVWVRAWALQPLQLQPPAVGLGVRIEF